MPLTHDEYGEIKQLVYDLLESHELLHPNERRGDRLEDALPDAERTQAIAALAARKPFGPAAPTTDLLAMRASMEAQFAAEMTALREKIDALIASQHAQVAAATASGDPNGD